jgi:hypothetical protein
MAAENDLYELVFGLSYAAICIPLAIGGAISVAALSQFYLGYALFLLSGIWTIGHWLISEPVKERRRLLRVFRKDSTQYLEAKKDYRAWLVTGTAIFTLVTFAALTWTRHTQKDFERDQVANLLEIKFAGSEEDNPMQANFTLTNHSNYPISKRHVLWCGINLLVADNRSTVSEIILIQTSLHHWVVSDVPHVPMRTSFSIGPRGDGQTDSCLSALNFENGKLLCGDILVNLSYFLDDQSDVQDQGVRFVYVGDTSGGSAWHEQPQSSGEDFCYSYLDPEQKLQRDREVANPKRPRPFHP